MAIEQASIPATYRLAAQPGLAAGTDHANENKTATALPALPHAGYTSTDNMLCNGLKTFPIFFRPHRPYFLSAGYSPWPVLDDIRLAIT